MRINKASRRKVRASSKAGSREEKDRKEASGSSRRWIPSALTHMESPPPPPLLLLGSPIPPQV